MNTALIAFIVFSILDVATSVYVIQRGGHEANPAMAWLISKLGMIPGFLAGKSVAVLLATLAWLGGMSLWPIATVQGIVVLWNGYQIYKQKHA